ncbi:hypothetical protein [Phenylobacterium sp.]|uniref:hypothetical protein n=1 Tax=Phenylobacterium sp. TaxID=1871053 RepID=UPI002C9D35BF|nr:hypothetical protein [Phenylobacterium sp.]HVI33965.1 hypothetical protein [Phenylobacterium sp.]
MSNDNSPELNRQAGIPLAGDATESGQVAHGSRREDVHFEPAPDHLVSVRHNEKPDHPLAPQLDRAGKEPPQDGPPIADVAVAAQSPSVWDARPPEDDADRSGNPTGH